MQSGRKRKRCHRKTNNAVRVEKVMIARKKARHLVRETVRRQREWRYRRKEVKWCCQQAQMERAGERGVGWRRVRKAKEGVTGVERGAWREEREDGEEV